MAVTCTDHANNNCQHCIKLRDSNELRSGNMTSQFFFSVYPETSWRIQMLMMLLQFYWMAGDTALHEWSVKQMIAWIHLL